MSGAPRRAMAAFDYAARRPTELSFTRGDLVLVDPSCGPSDPWWHGRLASADAASPSLKFPANYVQPIVPGSERRTAATAAYRFDARKTTELSVAAGESLIVINHDPAAAWLLCESPSRRGKVPANYLKIGDPLPDEEPEEPPPPPAGSAPPPAATTINPPPAVSAPTISAPPPTVSAPTISAPPPTVSAPTISAPPPTVSAPTITNPPPAVTAPSAPPPMAPRPMGAAPVPTGPQTEGAPVPMPPRPGPRPVVRPGFAVGASPANPQPPAAAPEPAPAAAARSPFGSPPSSALPSPAPPPTFAALHAASPPAFAAPPTPARPPSFAAPTTPSPSAAPAPVTAPVTAPAPAVTAPEPNVGNNSFGNETNSVSVPGSSLMDVPKFENLPRGNGAEETEEYDENQIEEMPQGLPSLPPPAGSRPSTTSLLSSSAHPSSEEPAPEQLAAPVLPPRINVPAAQQRFSPSPSSSPAPVIAPAPAPAAPMTGLPPPGPVLGTSAAPMTRLPPPGPVSAAPQPPAATMQPVAPAMPAFNPMMPSSPQPPKAPQFGQQIPMTTPAPVTAPITAPAGAFCAPGVSAPVSAGGGGARGGVEVVENSTTEMLALLSSSKGNVVDVQANAADSFLFNEPDLPDNILFTPSGELRGGTPIKIVDYVTRANSGTSADMKDRARALVEGFRLYITPAEFFEKVCTRFYTAAENVDAVQMACMEVLELWVTSSFRMDLAGNRDLLTNVQSFFVQICMAGATISAPVCEKAQKVNQLTKLFAAQMRVPDRTLDPSAYATAPETTAAAFLGIPAPEFAKQLALIQHNALASVSTGELLGEAWRGSAASLALGKHLAWTKNYKNALLALVVTAKRDGDRKKLLLRYSEIMEECYAIHNFAGFVLFHQVLTHPSIAALPKLMDKKAVKRLEAVATQTVGNYASLAQEQSGPGPCVPYFELWTENIGKVERDVVSTLPENASLWNWNKLVQCATAMRPVVTFLGSGGFKFDEKKQIIATILSVRTSLTEDAIRQAAGALVK